AARRRRNRRLRSWPRPPGVPRCHCLSRSFPFRPFGGQKIESIITGMELSLNTITNWLTAGKNNVPERGSEYLEVYRQAVEADFKAYDPGFSIGKWLGSGGFCDVFLVPNVNVLGKGMQTVVLR